jgi:ABC-type phosphate/phosphonate transport system substrate-binding protein
MRVTRLSALVALFGATFSLFAAPTPGTEQAPVRIGMPATMFRDVKPAVFQALAKPFYSLVEMQTGLKSEMFLIQTPDEMREQLETGKLHFGVFNGFEFAWMKQKSATLQPLMVAAPQHMPLQAIVVVNQSSPVKSINDLKDTAVAMPQGTREYVRLYMTRHCRNCGRSPSGYFREVTTPATPDTALHEVVDGKVQAAIVDGGMYQTYVERYKGRGRRLRVISVSEKFPESVVVYMPGMVNDDVIQRFRQGMSTAHATPLGRQLLSLWSMAGFQAIPANYNQMLAESLKNYPPPAPEK